MTAIVERLSKPKAACESPAVLRVLFVTAVGVWLGTVICFSYVVWPALHRCSAPDDATRLLGRLFPRNYLACIVCGFITSTIVSVARSADTLLRLALPVAGGFVCSLVAHYVLHPRMKAAHSSGSERYARLYGVSTMPNSTLPRRFTMKPISRIWTVAVLLALPIVVFGTPGIGLADSGSMMRKKLPTDSVVVPPDTLETRKVPTDAIVAPEHMQPGTHTLTLEVAQNKSFRGEKRFKGWSVECLTTGRRGEIGELSPDKVPPTGEVGWGEIEWYGNPCTAFVHQVAVRFDDGPLDGVPAKTIDRAVLTYDEGPGFSCAGWIYTPANCWQNGEGVVEPKPDGCAVVRVPAVDWSVSPPIGLLPYAGSAPAVRRLGPREWDVTEPFTWQNVQGAAPLGANPGFGFLLTGSITRLDDLEGEDSTICLSALSNLKLNVTYTVPQPSGPPDVIR
jgi:hypothetical protein